MDLSCGPFSLELSHNDEELSELASACADSGPASAVNDAEWLQKFRELNDADRPISDAKLVMDPKVEVISSDEVQKARAEAAAKADKEARKKLEKEDEFEARVKAAMAASEASNDAAEEKKVEMSLREKLHENVVLVMSKAQLIAPYVNNPEVLKRALAPYVGGGLDINDHVNTLISSCMDDQSVCHMKPPWQPWL